jgi:hypothetical protein
MKRKSIFFICLAPTCMFAALVVGVAAQQLHPWSPTNGVAFPITDD